MPLLSIFRFLSTLLSWLVVAGAAYCLWRWWFNPTVYVDDAGNRVLLRESWPLWLAVFLGAWSILGGLFWRLVLARGQDEERPRRGNGTIVEGRAGDRLYVESAGPVDRPTIILTHGAGNDSTVWYRLRHRFDERFRLIVWDLPGLGKSTGKVDLETYAENLRVLVQGISQPVVLVGHSMGGMVIQTLARRHPALFAKQIVGAALLNTTYTNPLKTMIFPNLAQTIRPLLEVVQHIEIMLFPLAWISSWQSYLSGGAHIATRLTFGRGVTRTQLDLAALLATRNSPASIASGNLAMFRWDATGAVANIPGPLLIIGADGDIVTKPEASRLLASAAVRPDLRVFSHGNHMSFLDHAEEYGQAVEAYVTSVFEQARSGTAR